MKQTITIALLCLTFLACKEAGSNGEFEVSGNIAGVKKQPVYLQQVSFDGSALQILDSATLGSNGHYKLHTIGKEEGLYVVGVPDGPQAIFINDNDNITINLDSVNFRHPQIKGSDATQSIYDFMTNYIKKDSAIGNLYKEAQLPGASDLAKQAFQQQITSLNNYIKDFINKSSSPAAVYFAVSQVPAPTMPTEDLVTLVNSAANRFKGHTGLNILKQRLTAMAKESAPSQYQFTGKPAPNLTMQDVNGKNISISDFKGKYLLVDFWASWCGPCRQENPNVVATYNKYKNKNFTILGVSLDDDKEAWKTAIAKDGLAWNHMSDLKQWESEAVKAYGFDGIPFNVLIDPNGNIIASSLRGPDLEAKLAEVLQ